MLDLENIEDYNLEELMEMVLEDSKRNIEEEREFEEVSK